MNKCIRCFPKGGIRGYVQQAVKNTPLKFKMIMLLVLLTSNSTSAQDISIKKDKSTLESILKEVGDQTGYVFFYKKEDIQSAENISVTIKSAPFRQALTTILKDTDLEFEIFEKTVVIKKKKPSSAISSIAAGTENNPISKPQKIIKGWITDENKLPLGQILIKELTSQNVARSNPNGEYTITVPSSGSLSFSGKGFSEQLVDYTDSTSNINVSLSTQSIELNNVSVIGNPQLKDPGRFVEIKNRNYMNLSQVLQGTIPGLTLQTVNANVKELTAVEAFQQYDSNGQLFAKFVRYSVDEFLVAFGKAKGQQIIDILLSGKQVPRSISDYFRIITTSKTTTTLVPQLRGANNFSANAAGMLVVIDGFPQDGFPADYPMINVESIEVIKDQKELIKWGPRASGGAILIKTKAAKKGTIQITYSSNFYYEPAPKYSRKDMGLASTPDYLDYLKSVDSTFNVNYTEAAFNFTPAKRLFAQKRLGLITTEQYNKSLDSLQGLNNEQQAALLQQDRFSQTHTLGLNGGNDTYKFNLIGNYSRDQTHEVSSYANTAAISLNNDIRLLKNKIKINWLINYSNGVNRSGYSFSPNSVAEPYQMLLDPQGNYVYDYATLSPAANAILLTNGYKNHGVNLLEDARVNRSLNRQIQKKSNFNLRWDLAPNIQWTTTVFYNGSNNNTRTINGKESSYVRQMVNTYGQYGSNGVNFYVPYGDIIALNNQNGEQWNLRSNLSYNKVFGKNEINLSAGAGGASTRFEKPSNATIYGYNNSTKSGSPIFLPSPNPSANISNFYALLPGGSSSSASPRNLTLPLNGDTALSRNLNGNVAVKYSYADRLSISGSYNSVLNPVYGQSASYSKLESYGGQISGTVFKNIGSVLKDIQLSAGVEGVKMPDLPVVYDNSRYLQPNWNNYAIWINSLDPAQQKGQSSRNYFQRMNFILLDSAVTVNAAYNTQKISGNLGFLNADPSTSSTNDNSSSTVKYLSAGIKGRLRKGLIAFELEYSKSPEGQSQINGSGGYDIAHENYFHSKVITTLDIGFKIQSISPYQGLGLMMGTNTATNGSFSQATNSDFSVLPPKNTSYELNTRIALLNEAYTIDLRYYNQTTGGLNNFSQALTDPATGQTSKVTYSSITNKGVELFLKSRIVKLNDFEYNATINGAYNVNIANKVPPLFRTASDSYTRDLREGYDISNLWSVPSAPLNNQGNPQIYDAQGNLTSTLDSATVLSALVYSGVTRAPWTGGFIHDLQYKAFFARAAFTFNFGAVMRSYIPSPGLTAESNVLIKDRWRQPGDENFTIVPKISNDNNAYRSFVVQNGTNSIQSADNIRFQEIMIGCNLPSKMISKLGLSSCSIAFQAQNVAVWSNNSLHTDPNIISSSGRINMPIPRQYSCNINVSF